MRLHPETRIDLVHRVRAVHKYLISPTYSGVFKPTPEGVVEHILAYMCANCLHISSGHAADAGDYCPYENCFCKQFTPVVIHTDLLRAGLMPERIQSTYDEHIQIAEAVVNDYNRHTT